MHPSGHFFGEEDNNESRPPDTLDNSSGEDISWMNILLIKETLYLAVLKLGYKCLGKFAIDLR
jgi:hypothetical protein